MADLMFKDFVFEKKEGKVSVNFLKMFQFDLDEAALLKIGKFSVSKGTISFQNVSENSARKKFEFLLAESIKDMKNKMSRKNSYYIHCNSGIPLIGTNYFGLVDRGSNIIEVKPITSCNISCIFCSVDEGPKSRRKTDYVVEKDYLVEELEKIVEFKARAKAAKTVEFNTDGLPSARLPLAKIVRLPPRKGPPPATPLEEFTDRASRKDGNPALPYGDSKDDLEDDGPDMDFKEGKEWTDPHIDAHINAQGEPLLYADMVDLVREIMDIPGVKTSSIDTNGLLLTKQMVDDLAEAGLTRINLSLHAMDKALAAKLADNAYNLDKVLEIARYIPKTRMDLIIVPVWLPGFNDEELPKLAKFAVEIGAGKHCPPIGIQSFLNYRFGRNPIEQVPLSQFYEKMRQLEKEHGIQLIFDKYAFDIEDLPELPKPFKKGQTIEAQIMLPGRIGSEKLAVAKGRLISIPQCPYEMGKKVKVRIRRTKHNIFLGELLD
jgi:uncharacterized Fe-S cluster-containing radical SAM superfamily enzyme